MSQPYFLLDNLLDARQLASLDALLAAANYQPPAAHESDGIRNNLQVPTDDRTVLPQIHQLLNMAITQQPLFQALFMPLRMLPFTISRYDQGHSYDWHVDHPIMGAPAVRTDLAMTLFLSEPTAYEGGEIELETPQGKQQVKLARGSAIVYSCKLVHRVNEVRSGRRLAAISWIQSAIRDEQQREILFNIQRVYQSLGEKGQHPGEANVLLQTWGNLMRMWSEA